MSHKVDDAATATAMQDHSERSRLMPRSTLTTVMSPRGRGFAGGMVPALAKHAGHHVEMFRLRFWWSLLLTVPVILTSHLFVDWFGRVTPPRARRVSRRCRAAVLSGGRMAAAEPTWTGDGQGGSARWVPTPSCTA